MQIFAAGILSRISLYPSSHFGFLLSIMEQLTGAQRERICHADDRHAWLAMLARCGGTSAGGA